jgi:hypothetical protein
VRVQWELLWPNPGTKVLELHRDLVSDEPFFATRATRIWRAEAIAERFPESVFARSEPRAWESVSLDDKGLRELITEVA